MRTGNRIRQTVADASRMSGRQLQMAIDSAGESVESASGSSEDESLTIYFPLGTPAVGADYQEITIPRVNGEGVEWNVVGIGLRVATAGGSPEIVFERSSGAGVFTATVIGTLTMGAGAYEVSDYSSGLGVLDSGDKVRVNVNAVGTAAGFVAYIELLRAQ